MTAGGKSRNANCHRASMWTSLIDDFRYGFRTTLRDRNFALVAIVTLALGIGINTAAFSVLRAVVLSSLPYERSGALTMIWSAFQKMGASRAPGADLELREIQRNTKLYSGVAGIWVGNATLTGTSEPQQIKLAFVTWNFFNVLGAHPIRGRSFSPGEEGNARQPAMVISDALWHRRFGADPGIIGRAERLDGDEVTIVGVLPPAFKLYFPPDSNVPAEIPAFLVFPYDVERTPRDLYFIRYLGRLKPGVTLSAAQGDLNAIAGRLRERFAEYRSEDLKLEATPLKQEVTREVRPPLLALMAGAAFVLLIACVNVANLLLARANGRREEIAVRASIGASRGRVIRQLIIESLALGLMAGAIGAGIGWLGVQAVITIRPESLSRLDAFRIDPVVLGFVLGISLAATTMFGMLPAFEATRLNLTDALRETGRGTRGSGHSGVRKMLVVAEITAGFVLLTGTWLMILTFRHLEASDPGFQARGVLTFEIGFPGNHYRSDEDRNRFANELEARIASLPEVENVGAVSHFPLDDYPNWYSPYTPEGVTAQASQNLLADYRAITPGYFQAMGARLLEGRQFTKMDTANAAPVVIVDDLLAAATWPHQDAVGKKLNVERFKEGDFTHMDAVVVGVVRHIQHHSLTRSVRGQIYIPYPQSSREHLSFAVKTRTNPWSIAPAIRREIRSMDKNLAISKVRPMSDYVSRAAAPVSFTALIASTFGLLGLLLAAVGVYSVTSYSMSQRSHEMAVRAAVGASRGDIVGLAVREGIFLVFCGTVLGVGCALLLARYLEALLFGVAAVNPGTYLQVASVLFAAAILACWVPAARISKQSIVTALRLE